MHLSQLPQFTVTDRRQGETANQTLILGAFSTREGVRDNRGWLYRGEQGSIIADLVGDRRDEDDVVMLSVFTEDLAPDVQRGAVFPWLDSYWQPYQLAMVLASVERWERRRFLATPARYFKLQGATGWQPVEAPLPSGAVDLGVREGAWDHEHCEICGASIGAAGEAEGFVDPDNRWLCVACYARYALHHDVSFAVEV
jgi:hypothetical protein